VSTGVTPGNTVCQNGWSGFANGWQNPTARFDPVVPLAVRYDPVTNPTGVRATFWDGQVNVFGIDTHTGVARSAYDNVGIQYGLDALNAGDITKQEFLDLNAKIGGLDIDGNIVPQRTEGSLEGIDIAYRTGRVVTSGENLTLPIIDTRDYRDNNADIHTRIRTFMFLDRLKRANGTTANQVNWLTARSAVIPNLARMALIAHNEWLEKILADTSDAPYAVKVVRNKPATLTPTATDDERCETRGGHMKTVRVGMRSRRVLVWRSVALVALILVVTAPALADNKLQILTLSNRPDKVSGGDALVNVIAPP